MALAKNRYTAAHSRGTLLWRLEPDIGWVPKIDPGLLYASIRAGSYLAPLSPGLHPKLLQNMGDIEPWLTDFDFIFLCSTARCAIIGREAHMRCHLLLAAKRRGDLRRMEEAGDARPAVAAMMLVALLLASRLRRP